MNVVTKCAWNETLVRCWNRMHRIVTDSLAFFSQVKLEVAPGGDTWRSVQLLTTISQNQFLPLHVPPSTSGQCICLERFDGHKVNLAFILQYPALDYLLHQYYVSPDLSCDINAYSGHTTVFVTVIEATTWREGIQQWSITRHVPEVLEMLSGTFWLCTSIWSLRDVSKGFEPGRGYRCYDANSKNTAD